MDNSCNEENGTSSPSELVIDTLAEKTESDPTDLPPLYEAIDPDALNELFCGREDGAVTFRYCGYEITISSTGEIAIREERGFSK